MAKRPTEANPKAKPKAKARSAAPAAGPPADAIPPFDPLPDLTPAPIVRALLAWFPGAARPMPWRTDHHRPPRPPGEPARDPWLCLMAEAMAQQTQLSRVAVYLARFAERFPTPREMAAAPESEVLAMWSGLGYYRRARNLWACARMIDEHFGGQVPSTVAELASLPGIGPYTAGALASIVFGRAEPIVDGNIARVLLRLAASPAQPAEKTTTAWLWATAGALVASASKPPHHQPGPLNEALMELGATVCTPKGPSCGVCPLAKVCKARAQGLQDEIPTAKPKPGQRDLYFDSLVLFAPKTRASGQPPRFLLQQRPSKGLWASMWQCPSIESDAPPPKATKLATFFPEAAGRVTPVGSFVHQTTHRRIHIRIHRSTAPASFKLPSDGQGTLRWATPADLPSLALSSATMQTLTMAGVLG